MSEPQISVVIPTIGRAGFLRATLEDLLEQEGVDWEILLVFQGEFDSGVLAAFEGRPRASCRAFCCDEPNASLARNVGLLEARSPVVLFLDDDIQIPERTFLAAHLQHYAELTVPGVAGRIVDNSLRIRDHRHFMSRHTRVGWLYFPLNYSRACRIQSGASCNLSVRRDWAAAVGGMDAQYERGAHREESDFCLRLTQRFGNLVFDPGASIIHLQASEGGSRAWSSRGAPHGSQHACGEWYFILKNVRAGLIARRDLPHHLLHLFRRQIWNRKDRGGAAALLAAARRCAEARRLAKSKLKEGPRCLSPEVSSLYSRIGEFP